MDISSRNPILGFSKIIRFFIFLPFLLFGTGNAFPESQVVFLNPGNFSTDIETTFSISVGYEVTDGNGFLSGLDLSIHFDSSIVNYEGFTNFLDAGDLVRTPILLPDTLDEDNDLATDFRINMSWASISRRWPGVDLPVVLAQLLFSITPAGIGSITKINASIYDHDANYGVALINSSLNLIIPQNPTEIPSSLSDNAIVRIDTANTGNIQNLTIISGVALDNAAGRITGAYNAGSIIGGVLSGVIVNSGIISGNVTLTAGTRIIGGKISGSLAGEAGSVITDSILDASSISGVTIGPGCRLTQNTVSNVYGLDLTSALRGQDGVVNPNRSLVVHENGAETSLIPILADAINNLLGDTTCTAQCDAIGRVLLSSQRLGDVVVPATVESVVTTSQGSSVSLTASGELVLIGNGLAITLTPASVDLASLESALQQAGCSLTMQGSGTATVGLPDGARFAFRFNNFATRSGDSTASGLSFSMAGTPEDPENFRLTVTYPDGSVQTLLPAFHDFGQFKAILETNNINYSIHPSMGVIQILDSAGLPIWRGIASYFVESPPAGATGLSLEPTEDRNNDGNIDFYMITGSARQLIYTLP